jgi:hypothetical protein
MFYGLGATLYVTCLPISPDACRQTGALQKRIERLRKNAQFAEFLRDAVPFPAAGSRLIVFRHAYKIETRRART